MEINLHKKLVYHLLNQNVYQRECTLYLWIKHENSHFFETKNVNMKIWERILQILKINTLLVSTNVSSEKALSEM